MSFDLNEQKVGIVVADNPKNHLHRLKGMKIIVGETWSAVHLLDSERGGKRAILRREKASTADLGRVARNMARKHHILRQGIEVQIENSEPKSKKA